MLAKDSYNPDLMKNLACVSFLQGSIVFLPAFTLTINPANFQEASFTHKGRSMYQGC